MVRPADTSAPNGNDVLDADRERVVDGLCGSGSDGDLSKAELANLIKRLAPRWFLLRDAHAKEGMRVLQPRWTMSLMLGPMTRTEIRQALGRVDGDGGDGTRG